MKMGKEMQEFLKDKHIVFKSFYLTNDLYGGLTFKYDNSNDTGSASFVSPDEIIEIAEKVGAKEIYLAGDRWKEIGKKGWGEKVSLEEAKECLKKIKEWRYNAENGKSEKTSRFPNSITYV